MTKHIESASSDADLYIPQWCPRIENSTIVINHKVVRFYHLLNTSQ